MPAKSDTPVPRDAQMDILANENHRLRLALRKVAQRWPCSTTDDMARVAGEALGEPNAAKSETIKTGLEYALSIWPDTRQDSITREDAAKIAEGLADFAVTMPCSTAADFLEGWEAAIETVALFLRFKDAHA